MKLNLAMPAAIAAAALSAAAFASIAGDYGVQARIALKVVDEAKKPVVGANVEFVSEKPRYRLAKDSGPIRQVATTDGRGVAMFDAFCSGRVSWTVSGEDIYRKPGSVELPEGGDSAVDFVVRRAKASHEMISRFISVADFEKTGAIVPVGYDVLVGDFVAPHGKGVRSDLLVSLAAVANPYALESEAFLCVDVADRNDGFAWLGRVGDGLRFEREAPEDGYAGDRRALRQVLLGCYSHPRSKGRRSMAAEPPLALRLRTQLSDTGAVAGAYYGYIDIVETDGGDVKGHWNYRSAKGLSVAIFLNKTPMDRNLERTAKEVSK